MRETCLFCVSKHLAQSIVLVSEACKGYPMHLWYAVGHLAEAEDESIAENPKLSANIRRVRLSLMGQEGVYNTQEHLGLLDQTRVAFAGSMNAETTAICDRIKLGGAHTPWRNE
jgi:hypothetical protein